MVSAGFGYESLAKDIGAAWPRRGLGRAVRHVRLDPAHGRHVCDLDAGKAARISTPGAPRSGPRGSPSPITRTATSFGDSAGAARSMCWPGHETGVRIVRDGRVLGDHGGQDPVALLRNTRPLDDDACEDIRKGAPTGLYSGHAPPPTMSPWARAR